MNSRPLVSIGLAVYNGEKFVSRAIESVINQTFNNWELIIVNDGSTDSTHSIIKSFNDPRITIINLKRNQGVANARNKYIQATSGKYLAIIDADDQWLENKLATQIDFLEKHPDYAICGTYANKTDGNRSVIWKYPTTDEEIKIRLIWGSAFIHSSLVIRSEVLTKYDIKYKSIFNPAEDYASITEIITKSGLRAINIPSVHLNYFLHDLQLTHIQKEKQEKAAIQISCTYLQATNINIKAVNSSYKLFSKLFQYKFSALTYHDLKECKQLFEKIILMNYDNKYFDQDLLQKSLSSRWFLACYHSPTGIKVLKLFFGANKTLSPAYPNLFLMTKFIIIKFFQSIKMIKI